MSPTNDFKFGINSFYHVVIFVTLSGYINCVEKGKKPIRFGTDRPVHYVEEVTGFPDPKTFFGNYVLPYKPVKMRGALHGITDAVSLWTDEYFLSLNIPADHSVHVETRKKEDRTQRTMEMHFKDFVRTYNGTEIYMVQQVPSFLAKDVVLAPSLQCPQLVDDHGLVEALMWYSSGGTKSVVHTDAVDNLNCLYSGQKEFVMVNPVLYEDKVDMDHPEGAYSGIDVDDVDYEKYPGLKEVEYELVNMSAGDCLYIPKKYIHQVRSHNRNIAINIWWDSDYNSKLDLDACNMSPDKTLYLNMVNFKGLESLDDSVDALKDYLEGVAKTEVLNFDIFLEYMSENEEINVDVSKIDTGKGYAVPLRKAFTRIDQNQNEIMEVSEVKDLTSDDWQYVQQQINIFEDNIDFLIDMWLEKNSDNQDVHGSKDEL